MPTVRLEFNPNSKHPGVYAAVDDIYRQLPAIVAPQMNIEGRELHDGGVGEKEIIVNLFHYSKEDLNINDIQITVIAHRFKERLARLDQMTDAIREGISAILQPELANAYKGMRIAVSVWLLDMGYATIETGD